MRIWSVHPQYLDRQGLTACWREGLLAQKVLTGTTKGYRNHPQLRRFRAAGDGTAMDDAAPDGAVPEGAVPDGPVPGGAVSDGSLPGGAVPEGAVPEGAVPDGATPGAVVPHGSVPSDPVPDGATPEDVAPAAPERAADPLADDPRAGAATPRARVGDTGAHVAPAPGLDPGRHVPGVTVEVVPDAGAGPAISTYLHAVVDEAERRGYRFDRALVLGPPVPDLRLEVTDQQLAYEWEHLKAKLAVRSPDVHKVWVDVVVPEPHPLFHVVPGPLAEWEIVTVSEEPAPDESPGS